MVEHAEKRIREAHEPGHDREKADAHDKRHREPGVDSSILLACGKFFRENRDENEIVDAKDDLEHDEGEETGPERRIKQKVHSV